MTPLERLTLFHGKLSDLSAVWWPFIFLRPESYEPITFSRTLAMSPCFAAWFLLMWVAKKAIFADIASITSSDIFGAYAMFLVGFLVWFNAVTAPLWNRRARSLVKIPPVRRPR